MKKIIAGLFVLSLLVTPASAFAAPAGGGESVVERVGDWFATVGKPQDQKDRILFERRAERATKRLGESFERGTKKAGKEMEKFGKEMEKSLQ